MSVSENDVDELPISSPYSVTTAMTMAAPEMFAALAAFVADVDGTSPDDEFGYAKDAPLVMMARAALAKALPAPPSKG